VSDVNHIDAIGKTALENNHLIMEIEIGGEIPYPFHTEFSIQGVITTGIATAQPIVSRAGYCYRTVISIRCIK